MMLADVRDYIDSLGIAEHVYMGKLPDKESVNLLRWRMHLKHLRN